MVRAPLRLGAGGGHQPRQKLLDQAGGDEGLVDHRAGLAVAPFVLLGLIRPGTRWRRERAPLRRGRRHSGHRRQGTLSLQFLPDGPPFRFLDRLI